MTLIEILTGIDTWLETVDEYVVSDDNDKRNWNQDILAVLRADMPGGKRSLHIRNDVLSDVLNDKDQEVLQSNGLVPRRTEYRTRLGRTRQPTFVLLYDDLITSCNDDVDEANKVHQLESRIRTLRRELKIVRESRTTDDRLLELVHSVADASKVRKPVKPLKRPKRKNQNLAGWGTLFLSDLHWDEVVDPAQIEGLNEYNHEIAVERLQNTFSTSGDLLMNHMAGAYYDGLVVMLGGDMLSGNIHEELRRTNDAPITESVLTLADELTAGIKMLAKEFPRIYVPCVVGNHGRYDRKPLAKGRVQENYDWLVSQLVARNLRDVDNVDVHVSEATDLQFKLYNTTYRLTHGDQFRGGGGIGGKWPTLFRGDYRKRKRAEKTGGGYDILCMGHWHAYGSVEGLVVNGSLKGYDEYAYISNFDYEPPTQACWITHPEYGMTIHMPIYADRHRKSTNDTEYVFSG